MDQSTHEVRLANWKAVIEQCQTRPKGQSAKQWLDAHGISDKKYYYWLRKIRAAVYKQASTALVPSEDNKLIDENSKDKDTLALIKYIADEDKEEKILENQQILVQPIVRNGKKATVGYQPDIWKSWD